MQSLVAQAVKTCTVMIIYLRKGYHQPIAAFSHANLTKSFKAFPVKCDE